MDDMTTGIIEIGTTGTELVERVAGDQHPVAIYLGSKSPGSRRAIHSVRMSAATEPSSTSTS